jgi:hypothetical protein
MDDLADSPGPADPAVPAAFRSEVARLRAAERRRLFPLGLQVGTPDGHRLRLEVPWPVPPELDPGLRFDLAEALVDAVVRSRPEDRPVWAWVTRPGVPQLHDCDLDWFAAVSRAVGAHQVLLAGFRAVTRTGWLDVVSGASDSWKRPRR